MIRLSEEELKELDVFAALMFSDNQLAEILEVSSAALKAEMMIEDSPVRRVISTARYRVEASLRKAQIEMALRGSTPAGAACNELLMKMRS